MNGFSFKDLVEESSTGHKFDPDSPTLQSSEIDLRTVTSFSVALPFFKMKDGVSARTCKPQRTETLILLRRRKEDRKDTPTLTPPTPPNYWNVQLTWTGLSIAWRASLLSFE